MYKQLRIGDRFRISKSYIGKTRQFAGQIVEVYNISGGFVYVKDSVGHMAHAYATWWLGWYEDIIDEDNAFAEFIEE